MRASKRDIPVVIAVVYLQRKTPTIEMIKYCLILNIIRNIVTIEMIKYCLILNIIRNIVTIEMIKYCLILNIIRNIVAIKIKYSYLEYHWKYCDN